MTTEQPPLKDAYYAWYRPTDEYLAKGTGWTKDVSKAFPCYTKAFAWSCLRSACLTSDRNINDCCVSLGLDLIDED